MVLLVNAIVGGELQCGGERVFVDSSGVANEAMDATGVRSEDAGDPHRNRERQDAVWTCYRKTHNQCDSDT